jgi:integrase
MRKAVHHPGIRERRGSFEVRYRDRAGVQHSQFFDTVTAALDFQSNVRVKRREGTWIDPNAGKVPVLDFAMSTYLSTKVDVHPATLVNIEGRIGNHFGDLATAWLRDVRPSDVLAWQAAKRGTRAAATVNAALRTLAQVFDLAVRDGLIGRNPCDGVRPLPAGLRGDIHPATPEQVVALADAINPRYRVPIMFAALGSGMRAGELWALRVDRVDFLRRGVRVVESVSETRGGLLTKPPKNGRTRTIRLDHATVEILAAHLRDYPSADGLVFTSEEGAQVRHRNFVRRHFDRAVEQVEGLPVGFRFHDLRHTHASILISRGWRPEQVKDRLGHGSIRTTFDWYGHLFEGHDDEQLEDLGDVIGPLVGVRVDQKWTQSGPGGAPGGGRRLGVAP